jgi:hypothetical protein
VDIHPFVDKCEPLPFSWLPNKQLVVVGFDSGFGEVDRPSIPTTPRYRPNEIAGFRRLRRALRAACRDGDSIALPQSNGMRP